MIAAPILVMWVFSHVIGQIKMVNPNVMIDRRSEDGFGALERMGLLAAIKDASIAACRESGETKLEIAKDIARLAFDMEKCCCDTRALIAEKAGQTDKLIRELDSARLARALELANMELVAARLSPVTSVFNPVSA